MAALSSPTTRTPARRRRAAGLGSLLLLLLPGACGDNPVFRDPGDVNGTWTLPSDKGDAVFLVVTADRIDEYREDPIADCFEHTVYTILETEGYDFRIASQTDTFSIELRREGDDLLVTVFDSLRAYLPSTQDVGSLTLCTPNNPGVVCAEQPGIAIGASIEGELASTDPENPDGSRRDLYRLDVAATTALRIDMSSTEVDSYLVLYEEDGAVHSQNDDRSNLTLDARLTPTLEPGCYLIGATSAGPGELGDYTLEVSTP